MCCAPAKLLGEYTLVRQLDELRKLKPDKLIRRRREKYLRMGQFQE